MGGAVLRRGENRDSVYIVESRELVLAGWIIQSKVRRITSINSQELDGFLKKLA